MKGLIFTYLLCYGGSLVSLFRPWYGFLIYVCFGIIKPEKLWHWAIPPGNYSRIIAIALLAGWAINGFGNWKFRMATWPVALMMLFLTCATLSASTAPQPEISWGFVEALSKIILPIFVGLTLIHSSRQLWQVAWTIVLSQGYVAFEQNLTYVNFGIRLDQTDNVLAHGMAVGAVLAFFTGFYSPKLSGKFIAGALGAMMAHTCMFQMSRGAMLGLAAGGLSAFFILPKTRRTVVAFILASVIVARLAGPSVQEEFSTIGASKEERDGSAQSRFDLWSDMWDATQRSPLIGIGPDHWPLVASSYGWPSGKEGHGLWVQIVCETGIPGGIAYFGMYAVAIYLLWWVSRNASKRHDDAAAVFARAGFAALCCHVLQAQFGSFEGLEIPYYVFLLGVGALRLATPHSSMARPFVASSFSRFADRPFSTFSQTWRY